MQNARHRQSMPITTRITQVLPKWQMVTYNAHVSGATRDRTSAPKAHAQPKGNSCRTTMSRDLRGFSHCRSDALWWFWELRRRNSGAKRLSDLFIPRTFSACWNHHKASLMSEFRTLSGWLDAG